MTFRATKPRYPRPRVLRAVLTFDPNAPPTLCLCGRPTHHAPQGWDVWFVNNGRRTRTSLGRGETARAALRWLVDIVPSFRSALRKVQKKDAP